MSTLSLPATKDRTSTPGRLKFALVTAWIVAGLLCAFTMAGTYQRYHAVHTVGVDAAPSVVAAQRTKVAMASLDVDVANELIAKPGAADATVQDFNKWRIEVGKQLVLAAKNITYGDAEQKPIEAMQAGASKFYMAVQAARDAHNRGDDKGAIVAYRAELSILDNELLPAAKDLEHANSSELESTYANSHSQSWMSLGLIIVSGLAMLGVLAWIQFYLKGRFHRRFNYMILGATVLSLLFSAYTIICFGSEMAHLKAAKEDSYDSVIALLEAKSESYLANASESRYLLDKDQAKVHEQYFFAKSAEIATFTGGMTLDRAVATASQGNLTPKEQFTGFLANELNNITFQAPEFVQRYGVGERDAATATLKGWGLYVGVDKKIRQLEASGQHDAAITLCLGNDPGQSNWAFAQFDSNLDKTLNINLGEMDRNTNKGFSDLALLPFAAPIVSLLIALLVFLGLRPRMHEYDV
jgi:hypothetical protein